MLCIASSSTSLQHALGVKTVQHQVAHKTLLDSPTAALYKTQDANLNNETLELLAVKLGFVCIQAVSVYM